MASSEPHVPVSLFERLLVYNQRHGLYLLRYLTPTDGAIFSSASKGCHDFFCGFGADAILVRRWWMGQCIILLTSRHLHYSLESEKLPWSGIRWSMTFEKSETSPRAPWEKPG